MDFQNNQHQADAVQHNDEISDSKVTQQDNLHWLLSVSQTTYKSVVGNSNTIYNRRLEVQASQVSETVLNQNKQNNSRIFMLNWSVVG